MLYLLCALAVARTEAVQHLRAVVHIVVLAQALDPRGVFLLQTLEVIGAHRFQARPIQVLREGHDRARRRQQ